MILLDSQEKSQQLKMEKLQRFIIIWTTEKIEQEALYDGLYAVTTDLLDDDVKNLLKDSEGRWEIEECFRIMKTDFEARPVFSMMIYV